MTFGQKVKPRQHNIFLRHGHSGQLSTHIRHFGTHRLLSSLQVTNFSTHIRHLSTHGFLFINDLFQHF
nr:MAG TPA: hypothetical protein [Caudoviricetes sp.]